MATSDSQILWEQYSVNSPHLASPVPVIIAKNIPYFSGANRFQNLSIYLPKNSETTSLIGQPATSLPLAIHSPALPQYQVHIHGGAWRDPNLSSTSIEAAAAHTFLEPNAPIKAIVSLNYTLSPFPTHPALPYDPAKGDHWDPAREAVHPQHVHDVLHGLALLKTLGLTNGSYVLTGHSTGACLALQSTLRESVYWGLDSTYAPPLPAAVLAMNGLYDLLDLVDNLGESHAHVKPVYFNLQSIAFGSDQQVWAAASPARADPVELTRRVREGQVPTLIVLEQSLKDQLVPVNQTEKMESLLKQVQGLKVVRGHRCTGVHAAPWEQGYMISDGVKDVLGLLVTDGVVGASVVQVQDSQKVSGPITVTTEVIA